MPPMYPERVGGGGVGGSAIRWKKFVPDRLEQLRGGQKYLVPARRAQRTNQEGTPVTSTPRFPIYLDFKNLYEPSIYLLLSGIYLKNADRLFERGLLVVLDPLEALCAPLPRRKRVNLLHQLENRRHLLGIEPVHLAAEKRTKIHEEKRGRRKF